MFGKRSNIWLLLIVLCWGCESCTSRAVHDAESVVAQADSLRAEGRMYGIDEGDSATLAQAYETLSIFNSPLLSTLNPQLSTVFSHSCYHYGRLLREKDNPVGAMECFINATHSRTRDYHILGRVYSNMGDICHLASDFRLSYDMYSNSSDYFYINGDTINYYYGLYRMAFEKAVLGENNDTLLHLIKEANIFDSLLNSCYLLTKAKNFLNSQQYDSVIYYALSASYFNPIDNTSQIMLAQAYSYLGVKDSAVYYANIVLNYSCDLANQNNALFILTNDDASRDIEKVRQTAADRSDVQKLLEIRQGKMSQAVQLLEHDLNRKPDWRWLYAIVTTLTVVGVGIIIYVYRKRKKQELLAQKLDALQQATSTMQEKHDELTTNYLNNHQHIVEEINNKCSVLRDNNKIYTTLAWKNYHKMCSAVDKQFYLLASKLQSKNCLNETEIRLSVLTLLDCSYDQMAELLFRSTTSIGTQKTRVAKKLGTSSKNLRQYLIDNECLK